MILSITDTCKDQCIQCQKRCKAVAVAALPTCHRQDECTPAFPLLGKDQCWSCLVIIMHIIYGMPITSCQCNCPKHIHWRWFLVTSNYKASQATVTGVYIIICFNLKLYWIATCNWLHAYIYIYSVCKHAHIWYVPMNIMICYAYTCTQYKYINAIPWNIYYTDGSPFLTCKYTCQVWGVLNWPCHSLPQIWCGWRSRQRKCDGKRMSRGAPGVVSLLDKAALGNQWVIIYSG